MRRHIHQIVPGIAALVLAGTIASCGSDDQPSGSQACALVKDTTASTALGAASVESSDESKDLGGAATNILTCRYTPDAEGPALVVTASQASSAARAESNVRTTQSSCPDAESLDIAGVAGFVCSTGDLGGGPQADATWDGFVVHAALTTTRSTDQPDAGPALASVIEDVHERLAGDAFELGG
ncbi:MAG: hypothetical protein JWR55_19 [Aeromicrobium sp.]|nr:hypothetical protein [Aeromicrobium sp.]